MTGDLTTPNGQSDSRGAELGRRQNPKTTDRRTKTVDQKAMEEIQRRIDDATVYQSASSEEQKTYD
jgi:oligoribonuclease (3'-5' exoribonuclease)